MAEIDALVTMLTHAPPGGNSALALQRRLFAVAERRRVPAAAADTAPASHQQAVTAQQAVMIAVASQGAVTIQEVQAHTLTLQQAVALAELRNQAQLGVTAPDLQSQAVTLFGLAAGALELQVNAEAERASLEALSLI